MNKMLKSLQDSQALEQNQQEVLKVSCDKVQDFVEDYKLRSSTRSLLQKGLHLEMDVLIVWCLGGHG